MTDNDIELVVGNVSNYFLLDEIKGGTPIYRKPNKKWRMPGGLCSVYKYQLKNGETKALRIWKTLISESKERYFAISQELAQLNSPYFVDFRFIEKAFSYNGVQYPILLMEWCDGDKLKKYIYDNISNSQKIENLATSILLMARQIHKYRISHGDLQHDNILVKQNGAVVLIDYDSMYVPNIKGFKDECAGYSGYQHPVARSNNYTLSLKVDYFSELILYLSIKAIAKAPSLLAKYTVDEQDKSLLFSVSDFTKLKTSSIYNDVKLLGNDFKILLDILELYLSKNDINDLEPFYIVAKRMGLQLPSLIESLYCIHCGSKFMDDSDNYCIDCGTKRCDL
jgi:serine/threonine protein kinase